MDQPKPPYTDLDRNAAYQLHYHFLFQTRRNRPVFEGEVADRIGDLFNDIADRRMYHILEAQIQPDRLETLLSLRPFHSPSRTVRMIKGPISHDLFATFPELEQQIGTHHLWGASYWVASSGVMTTAMIKAYVDSQWSHHQMTLQEPRVVSRYAAPDRESYLEFRKAGRAVFLLHYHFVFTVNGRHRIIDEETAEYLTNLILRICDRKDYIPLSIDLAEDHAHMVISGLPTHSPVEIAEALMNNTSYLLLRDSPRLNALFPQGQFWVPGFFVRTVGPKTTAQIKSYFHKVTDNIV